MLQRLKDKVTTWLAVKAVGWAFERLKAEHLGQQLNVAMDAKVGKTTSDPVQQHLAAWLREVAKELEA